MTRIPYLREVGAVIALALVCWAGVKLYGEYKEWRQAIWQAGYDAANVRAEQVIREFAEAERNALQAAREIEQRRVNDLAALSRKHQQEIEDAQARADRIADELRAGNRRLRHEIAAYATERLSRDSAAAGELSEDAERGAAYLAAVVRVAAESDAQVRGLIEAYEALRKPAPEK
jgi:phosphotransacetylase